MAVDRRKAIVVTLESDQLQEVSRKWDQLPAKQTDVIKISEVVESMYDAIYLLRSKKYSWEEICEQIEQDFKAKIAPVTLQQHLRKIRKDREAKAKKLRSEKKQLNKSVQESKVTVRSNGLPDILQDKAIILEKIKIETEQLPFDIDQHLEGNEVSSEDVVQNFEQIINQPLSENSSGSRTKRRSRFND